MLLELEMKSFLPIIFKLFFKAGFAGFGTLQVLTIIRKSFLIYAAFIPIYSSCLRLVFSIARRPIFLLSLCILTEFVKKSKEKQSHFTEILKMYQN